MPRLPTIRVIGSQDISTRLPDWVPCSGMVTVAIPVAPFSTLGICGGVIPGGQLGPLVPPFRLMVGRILGEPAQGADDPAVHADGGRRERGARGRIHERHELVVEAGHR